MKPFEELLAESVAAHGHLCPGQVVGVRMALLGLRLLDFQAPPTLPQLKQLIVFVEMDRCTGDAVAHTTGVKLGRRSLKFVDYGIMAATFVNLATDQAFRVISTEESRDLAMLYAPGEPDPYRRQLQAYKVMPECVMFRVQEVKVDLTPFDLPGPTRRKAICGKCGQVVRDNREVKQNGAVYCRPCALGAYFTQAREIAWPEMNLAPAPAPKPGQPIDLDPPGGLPRVGCHTGT
ncbi:MAG: formylmethanofuran dehydrogenase [Deltaproteobacteria bacterium]|nr:formylmethanofuran dehydrogenase [Deltaproteobacteria bacterium]